MKLTTCYLAALLLGNVLEMRAFMRDVDAVPFNSDSLSHFLNTRQTSTEYT